MTAPTTPTLEELIAILSKPLDEGHPDERMGALQSAVLAALRRLATAEAELARKDAALELARQALCSDPPHGPQKHIVGDGVIYHLDGQTCGHALNAIREALGAKP